MRPGGLFVSKPHFSWTQLDETLARHRSWDSEDDRSSQMRTPKIQRNHPGGYYLGCPRKFVGGSAHLVSG